MSQWTEHICPDRAIFRLEEMFLRSIQMSYFTKTIPGLFLGSNIFLRCLSLLAGTECDTRQLLWRRRSRLQGSALGPNPLMMFSLFSEVPLLGFFSLTRASCFTICFVSGRQRLEEPSQFCASQFCCCEERSTDSEFLHTHSNAPNTATKR